MHCSEGGRRGASARAPVAIVASPLVAPEPLAKAGGPGRWAWVVRRMFRVTLICDGLPASAGEEAARDITKEFADSRQWHARVTCEWDGARLILRSENDFDETGQATLDEFSDCIFAYIAEPGEFSIRTESVQELA